MYYIKNKIRQKLEIHYKYMIYNMRINDSIYSD